MVIGGDGNGGGSAAPGGPPSVPLPQFGGACIDNIMSGIENTGTVKMNNHRKKLRQRFDIIKKLGQGKSEYKTTNSAVAAVCNFF